MVVINTMSAASRIGFQRWPLYTSEQRVLALPLGSSVCSTVHSRGRTLVSWALCEGRPLPSVSPDTPRSLMATLVCMRMYLCMCSSAMHCTQNYFWYGVRIASRLFCQMQHAEQSLSSGMRSYHYTTVHCHPSIFVFRLPQGQKSARPPRPETRYSASRVYQHSGVKRNSIDRRDLSGPAGKLAVAIRGRQAPIICAALQYA